MQNTFKVTFAFLMFLFLSAMPSYADWHGHDHGHYHGHSSVSFSFGYPGYYDPYYAPYYSYYPEPSYVYVSPPNYQPVVVNGVTYYTNNGTYYQYTSAGYVPVAAPVVVQPLPIVESENTVTVNIPNNSGGYTPVIIKRSGNGFVGPQGEFYSEFPKVSQLKTMYAK